MVIEFKREFKLSKLLDPASNFEEKAFPIELRKDPLSDDMASVTTFRMKKLEKPDISQIVAKSLEIGCPFCPEAVERITPKFTPDFYPEGRIKVGEAVVFPNAMPYMPYNAITVIGSQHFIALSEFKEDMLVDGFLASQV